MYCQLAEDVQQTIMEKINNVGDDLEPPPLHQTIVKGVRMNKNKGWILKQSDKNLGPVLMRPKVYNVLVSAELHEDTFSESPAFPHAWILRNLIELFTTCGIPRKEYESCINYAKDAKEAAPFFIIPKIDKPTLKSRPIRASHSYMLSDLSRELSSILNAEVAKIPAISINSKEVVVELEHLKHLPTSCVLLTYDFERFYPSIDTQDAIQTLE